MFKLQINVGWWLIALSAIQGSATDQFEPRPGFVIEKVAGEPRVKFPMFAAFDDSGRLFVTESSGGDLYAEISRSTRNCRVSLLTDRNGDGTFDTATVFAERLNFPMGLAWREGKLYLADPPDLVTLEDTDGDGHADRRTVILTGFGHRDNGSLHGLRFGPDGWLYMTCGEPDGYKIKRADGSWLEGNTGALLRCRPDGSGIEVLCRGFVNLVEVVFTDAGEIIGTDNWFQWPSGGLRDGLVHLVPGGLYPLHLKDVGTQHPVLGDPLPAISMFPAVALSGLELYRGSAFPAEMRGNLFSAQHNARKVGRHILARDLATFRSSDEDFLTTSDPDFHPSDVLEAPDGSLIVIDTGSWYVQHCPTGRIRNSPAVGGIYRVSPSAGAHPPSRVVVGAPASHIPSSVLKDRLLDNSSPPDAIAAAARILGARGEKTAAPALVKLLTSAAIYVRAAAAEALAHCGGSNALPRIWDALESQPDRFLEHALTYAAHYLADESLLTQALERPSPAVQKAALLLLDQPPRPRTALGSDAIVARLQSTNSELRLTALKVLQHRPEWVEVARKLIGEWLSALNTERNAIFPELVLAFQHDAGVQDFLAAAIERGGDAALDAVARTTLPKVPPRWATALDVALGSGSLSVRSKAVAAISALNIPALDPKLNEIADGLREPDTLRIEALRALTTRTRKLNDARVAFVLEQVRRTNDPAASLLAAQVLRAAQFTTEQLASVLQRLPTPSPVQPGALLSSFIETTDVAGATALLDALAELRTRKVPVRSTDIAALSKKLPAELRPRMAELQRNLEEDESTALARLRKFEPLLTGGEPYRGRAIFFSPTTACATCHAIGLEGGHVGPDLTKIGAIRAGKDILESVLFPSSTFAQGYEPYLVITTDGREVHGMMSRQFADSIVLRDVTGSEMPLERSQIRELRPEQISIMPEGLEAGLTETEFRDLLAFLRSLK